MNAYIFLEIVGPITLCADAMINLSAPLGVLWERQYPNYIWNYFNHISY